MIALGIGFGGIYVRAIKVCPRVCASADLRSVARVCVTLGLRLTGAVVDKRKVMSIKVRRDLVSTRSFVMY